MSSRNGFRAKDLIPHAGVLAVLAVAATMIGRAAPATASEVGSPPVIAIADPVHDFGRVSEGTRVVHRFRVENRGGRELRIEEIKTSCQCTAAVAGNSSLPPGGAGEIELAFDTSYELGRRTRTATVYSNDPDRPTVNVALTGEVTAPVTVVPRRLYLGRVPRSEGATRDLTVNFDTARRAQVVGVQTGQPGLTASVAKGDSSRQRITVRLQAGAPPGRFNDTLRIFTTVPGQAIVEVPVFGSIEGDLAVSPPQVDFGLVRLPVDEPPVREVWVRNKGAVAVDVAVAEAVPPSLRAEVETIRPGRLYRVRVRLDPGTAPGPLRGHVRLDCDHPGEPRLNVPVLGVVAEPAVDS